MLSAGPAWIVSSSTSLSLECPLHSVDCPLQLPTDPWLISTSCGPWQPFTTGLGAAPSTDGTGVATGSPPRGFLDLCHLGLASVPQVMQCLTVAESFLASLKWSTRSPSTSISSDLTVTAAGEILKLLEADWGVPFVRVLFMPFKVEVRRVEVDPMARGIALVEELTRFALRTVPVKVRSACL